jgi:hypothetical protein
MGRNRANHCRVHGPKDIRCQLHAKAGALASDTSRVHTARSALDRGRDQPVTAGDARNPPAEYRKRQPYPDLPDPVEAPAIVPAVVSLGSAGLRQ